MSLCAIAGVTGGFLWALHHQYVAPKHVCASRHLGARKAQVLGACIGSDLSHAVLAWIIPIGVGAIIGMLVALPLVLMIRLGRSSAR